MRFSIEINDVTFAYEGCQPTFSGITATLKQGEVVGLVAAVGGGKSTFLKLCAGLLPPTSGEVVIEGKRFWALSEMEQNALRRRMGFDFQEGALIANMTVFQNLGMPMVYHGRGTRAEIKAEVDGWLALMRMDRYWNMLPAALSAGLRRRVSYIRAMMTDGAYFFWDEPTEGGDELHSRRVTEAIAEKKKAGRGSLVSTQDLSFLASVADRVLVLRDGRICYDGPLKGGKIPVESELKGMVKGTAEAEKLRSQKG
ncbi:MAG: ATP-binding cassette domain-containing protein [Proteobacteria bacterium]|nr:ATP-binding cassette domain-containing protein [Pseudomonadota bacterium]